METLLEAQNLAVGYGARTILSNIEFSLGKGESMLIIGHNGAGKSTLLKTLFGIQPAQGGQAHMFGKNVEEKGPMHLVQSGGRYLAQGLRYFGELRVNEHRHVLDRLYPVGNRHTQQIAPDGHKKVKDLSVGQRRLEALSLLLAGNPRLLLLDEPTAAVDIAHSEQILGWINTAQDKGIAVVVVEHNFERMFDICTKTIVLRDGQGTYYGSSATLKDIATLKRFFL